MEKLYQTCGVVRVHRRVVGLQLATWRTLADVGPVPLPSVKLEQVQLQAIS